MTTQNSVLEMRVTAETVLLTKRLAESLQIMYKKLSSKVIHDDVNVETTMMTQARVGFLGQLSHHIQDVI